MKSADLMADQIFELMESTNKTIESISETAKETAEELKSIRNDTMVFGSVMLALVELLIEKGIMTQKEFDVEQLRTLARLDQEFSEVR